MPRPRKYPPELLDRGARLVFESGRPIAQVARDLGLHPEALRKWVLSGAFRRQRSSVHESGGTPDLYGGIAERSTWCSRRAASSVRSSAARSRTGACSASHCRRSGTWGASSRSSSVAVSDVALGLPAPQALHRHGARVGGAAAPPPRALVLAGELGQAAVGELEVGLGARAQRARLVELLGQGRRVRREPGLERCQL